MSRMSIATIDKPEFINLQPLDINPLMSSCEIKVFYVGENRNRSYISKDTAMEMSKTLRGAPIVGYYREQAEDFGDHGEQLIMDADGMRFNCLTKPYGFVAPDAKVWFQKFEEQDEFGNSIIREYLMTTGYLWTGQYEEAQQVLDDGGKPHSMELDEKSLEGHWAENFKNGMDFFIINDAVFSKLCILGDDVEPCFEGSTITAPEISTSFTKVDEKFTKTLYSMMQELKTALEGGTMTSQELDTVKEEFSLENQDKSAELQDIKIEENIEEVPSIDFVENKEDIDEEKSSDNDNKTDDEEEKKEEEKPSTKSELEGDTDLKSQIETLTKSLEELQTAYSELEESAKALADFKAAVEKKEKEDFIANEFAMLSAEDTKDIVDNLDKYSLEEIDAKLSVIGRHKGVNFSKSTEIEIEEDKEEIPSSTYTINIDDAASDYPDWVNAVTEVEKNMK